ncbi:DoxX domain protein [Natronomonas moolapensis 8.8.11]|uniref:DoxX domain protein n=1 Tax=Natronomonas moolapensis (strain DSM 18674 / CECT 7526 / JCM 14361 / 8.8.11) TaxID=268739 RepID=M1XSC3_NATM8|nr:DoxX-like family protein [Natronomonas moolapensis]CCQ37222.1 DoxX domain protein [Natronomonas moolapensis 8.8.11]
MTDANRLRRPLLFVMGPLYVVAGVLHFVVPELYVQIVPPMLPAPLALVYLSGIAEIAVGVGVLLPRTRRYAAWATAAVLLAVFPANVYMATHGVVVEGLPGGGDPSEVVRWGRLPLQGVLILWALWYTRPRPEQRRE